MKTLTFIVAIAVVGTLTISPTTAQEFGNTDGLNDLSRPQPGVDDAFESFDRLPDNDIRESTGRDDSVSPRVDERNGFDADFNLPRESAGERASRNTIDRNGFGFQPSSNGQIRQQGYPIQEFMIRKVPVQRNVTQNGKTETIIEFQEVRVPIGGYGSTAYQPGNSRSQKAISKLRNADDVESKKNAETELREALAEEYEQFMKVHEDRLAQAEARLESLKAEVKRRREAKDELLELRLKTIINNINGLAWPGDELQVRGSGNAAGGYTMPMVQSPNYGPADTRTRPDNLQQYAPSHRRLGQTRTQDDALLVPRERNSESELSRPTDDELRP